jgi:NTE family protein/lysophospholipid hydrolase
MYRGDEVIDLLRDTALLGGLDDDVLRGIEGEVEPVGLPGGAILMREGDPADCLYIVASGRLRVTVERSSGADEVVGEVGRGESVGEMALLIGGQRSATVRAIRDSQLLRLSKTSFDALLHRAPGTAMELARMLVLRLQHTLHAGRGVATPTTIALVAASRDIPLGHFARALMSVLLTVHSVEHVDSRAVDVELGAGAAQTPADDPANARVVGWLNEREARASVVLYEADAVPSEWTTRCLRQADRILVVARADGAPTMEDVEAGIWANTAGSGIPKELVLLHDPMSAQPARTRAWLAPPRQFQIHHHLRPGCDEDLARLARMVSGQAVGLVLGGGGARAFAHIGVIQAFREAGIAIDLIGGTSMGAVIAAQYAMGWDQRAMRDATRRAFLESGSLFDYTVPLMSLIGGRRFVRTLAEMFGSTSIEDLWVKYFCVSTNLTRGEQVVHETGLLRRWLCASITVPGLAPPLFHDGDLLVDGSVLNTVPADIMRRFARGPVVAVDVTARVDVGADAAFRDTPSAWQLLRGRLDPFTPRRRAPTLYKILLRTTMLSSAQSMERLKDSVDLYIQPPVEGFDLLDWKAMDRVVDLGYRAGEKAVRAWQAGAPPPDRPR